MCAHCWASTALAGLLIAAAMFGFTRIPTGFIPTEDQGYLIISVQLPDAASLERTEHALERIVGSTLKIPGVAHVISIGGISPLDGNATLSNGALVYVTLNDWSKRGTGQDLRSIYGRLNAEMRKQPGIEAVVLVPPPINGLGLSGGFQMQVELTDGSGDYEKLSGATRALVAAANADPRILLAFSSLRVNVPQIKLTLNAARAETLGLTLGDAYGVLGNYLGPVYANQFPKFGQNFPVYLQADGPFRRDIGAIGRLTVRNRSGVMVPLSAFMDYAPVRGPAIASQYNLLPSAAINGAAAAGHSSGEALRIMERTAARLLPPGVDFEWTAMSYQEKLVGGTVDLVFGLALLLVYLVLAAQYESWLTPIPVLLAVPLSLVGTVALLTLVGLPNNIYVQIGLVLLIALSAKNAILIVEVAHELQREGADPQTAALEGSRRRFRPILMTSIAFILGVVPLILSNGAGAAARKSIGVTVFSGMLASTLLAVAFVPVFFVLTGRWQIAAPGGARRADPTRPAGRQPGCARVIAQFFIERPVLANVIAILTLVLGSVAIIGLPVNQYPQLTPPTIQVTTSYPGASATAVQQQVARAIEQQVNGVEGMIYMHSYASNDGDYSLTVSFAVGTNPDQAQVAVQNRVNIALPTLPTAVQQQGVSTKKKSTAILQIITVTSSNPAHDALFLSNFASLQLRDRLARLPGVADVNVFGIGQYSMRVWLDTAQMAQRGLDPSAVINVINQQNQTIGAGQIGMPPAPSGQQQQLTVTVDNPLSDPADFAALVVATAPDGSITRLRDVARLELGSVNYNQDFHFDNRAAGGITDLSAARCQRAGHGPGGASRTCAPRAQFPGRHAVRRSVRHHDIRQGVHSRGLPDLVRSRNSGSDRDSGVPAELARDDGAGHHRTGDDRRRVRRDGAARLQHQSVDVVCPRTVHRHRGGRCHRRG